MLQPSQSQTLTELSGELQFFTPALLSVKGRFGRDPCRQYVRELGPEPEETPFPIDCTTSPFFEGLGQEVLEGQIFNWDHRLYGVPREHWEPLWNFLTSISGIDPHRRRYWRAMSHVLKIVDPTSLAASSGQEALPTIHITVIGVSAMDGRYHLAPAKDPPRTYPYPRRAAPDSNVVRQGMRALAHYYS